MFRKIFYFFFKQKPQNEMSQHCLFCPQPPESFRQPLSVWPMQSVGPITLQMAFGRGHFISFFHAPRETKITHFFALYCTVALVTYQLIFPSSSYSLRYTKIHIHRDADIAEPEPLHTITNLPLATDWGKEHEKEINHLSLLLVTSYS